MTGMATENLYLAAFARTHGAVLRRVLVTRTNGRQTAVFELDGPWVQKLSDEFYGGTAIVNLRDYREHLEEMKDELFAALRKSEMKRARRSHAPHRVRRAGGARAQR